MYSSSTLGVLIGTTLLLFSIPDAASYTKYGRTCKDIGCGSDQVCVMAEDPCSLYQRDNCGRYPTCTKSHPGEANCASTVCGENQYCKTQNGLPTCVKKSTAIGYEGPGISYVNGHRISTDDNRDKTVSNSASNSNPYANANAPPAPADPAGGYYQVNTGNNFGYPSISSSNNGYPPYPSKGNSNSGYPPYPSKANSNSGYPPYPSNRGSNNGYPTYSGYPGRRNDGTVQSPSLMVIFLASLIMIFINRV